MSSEKAIITVLCMIWRNDEMLLQNRIAENWPGVTFPGGHVEPLESFVEAVKREMKEETGLTIANPRLCGVKQYQSDNDERYVVLLFKTNEFSGEVVSSREGEMMWVKRDEIDAYPIAPDFKELLKVVDSNEYQELIYRPEVADIHQRIELY
ncbi:MAG: 8-oxo-dGTP diphosphatase [Raoultibacter sp.]